jgi:hypothetical protein
MKTNELKVEKTMGVWVVYTNEDLTEGRGRQYPLAVCQKQATALRVGSKKYVQGCDCPIKREIAVLINGNWLVPGRMLEPSKEDIEKQKAIDAKRDTIAKAKKLGLTDEELEILKFNINGVKW